MPKSVETVTEPLTKQEHQAIRACQRGEAEPHQQALAIATIVQKLARTHDLSYVAGDPHAGAFLAGRQYVGYQVIKWANEPVDHEEGGSS